MASTPEFDIMHTSARYHKANSIMQDLGRSDNNRSLSRTTSVMSIASLDLQLQEAEAKPISTLRDVLSGETSNLRLGPLVHLLLISCLLLMWYNERPRSLGFNDVDVSYFPVLVIVRSHQSILYLY